MQSSLFLPLVVATVLVLPLLTAGALPKDAAPFLEDVKAGVRDGEAFRRTWSYSGSGYRNRRNPAVVLRDEELSPPSENVSPEARSILGTCTARPCCVSWGYGRVDCFTRGWDSQVWHQTILKGSTAKPDWHLIAGVRITNEITCVARAVGVIDLVVVSHPRNTITVNTYESGKWGKWRPLVGIAAEAPTCVSTNWDSIDCVFRGISNLAYHLPYRNGNWGPTNCLGTELLTPLGCVVKSPSGFDCYAAGSDNGLRQISFDVSFGKPVDLGGDVTSKPSVVLLGDGRTDVFVQTLKNRVAQKTWDGEWLPWNDLGGLFGPYPPECIATERQEIYCFGLGRWSAFLKNVWKDGAWSGWTTERTGLGPFLEQPFCVLSDLNEISCYARNIQWETIEFKYQL